MMHIQLVLEKRTSFQGRAFLYSIGRFLERLFSCKLTHHV